MTARKTLCKFTVRSIVSIQSLDIVLFPAVLGYRIR